jgi:hypothetical protein
VPHRHHNNKKKRCLCANQLHTFLDLSLLTHAASIVSHEHNKLLFPLAAELFQNSKTRTDFRSFGSTIPAQRTWSADCEVKVEDVGYIHHSRAKLASGCAAFEEA